MGQIAMQEFEEIWRPIEGFPNNMISNLGRVKNIVTGTILRPLVSKRGYQVVGLYRGGKRFTSNIHRLVLEGFVGKREEKQICRHLDGDKMNNSLQNLAWGSYKENEADKRCHGTSNSGLHRRRSSITLEIVCEARRMYSQVIKANDISILFGVSRTGIYQAIRGLSWKFVTEVPPCDKYHWSKKPGAEEVRKKVSMGLKRYFADRDI